MLFLKRPKRIEEWKMRNFSSVARTLGLFGALVASAHAAEPIAVLASVDATARDFCKVPLTTVSGSKVLDGQYVGQCRKACAA